MVSYPKLGLEVENSCIECGRHAQPGEVYGTGVKDWDFTDLCPLCWDNITHEDNWDDPDILAEIFQENI
jgi:hypothetical protein